MIEGREEGREDGKGFNEGEAAAGDPQREMHQLGKNVLIADSPSASAPTCKGHLRGTAIRGGSEEVERTREEGREER
jgi:hypothetical protein